ncbi:MAG TPA: SDR family oxidoreductase [Candidatus Omnitrophota bacterium]|nr:SDR family oxidoreductase [Candidatus Omnitrophota bacterium]
MKLKGLVAVITGASQGLGEAVAVEFVKQGADVLFCARGKKKLLVVQKKLRSIAGINQKIYAETADISKEKDVKKLIGFALKKFGRVDVLVNNAGIYGPKGPVETLNGREWAKAIQINLCGVFYCCKYVTAQMKKKRYGKIINLSGGGATVPLPFLSAYAASKAAVVRLTETLAEECRDFNIDINSVAPGALNTRLLEEVLAAGPQTVGEEFYKKALEQKKNGGVSLEVGAKLCAFLASSESDGISGRLISAVWDPWKDLPKHAEELKKTDIYTLRRIIPKDRNKSWGNK